MFFPPWWSSYLVFRGEFNANAPVAHKATGAVEHGLATDLKSLLAAVWGQTVEHKVKKRLTV
jgi:hypothetical protein